MAHILSANLHVSDEEPARRRLSERALLSIYVTSGIIAGCAHLILGADLAVVSAAVASLILSVLPAARYGWRDLPSLFSLLCGVRYVASALFWKLFELSPLDEGLYSPLSSFTVIFVGTTAVTAAAFCAHTIWPSRPVFAEKYDARGYSFLLIVSTALIVASFGLRFSDTRLLGGFERLVGNGWLILPMAYMGFNIYTSRSVVTPGLVVLLLGLSVSAFGFNSRQAAVQMLIAMILMYLSFGFKLKKSLVTVSAALLLVFSIYIAPAMTDVRTYRGLVGPMEMISLTVEAVGRRLSGDIEERLVNPSAYQLKYLKLRNDFTERAVGVQQLDFLVVQTERYGFIGTDRFWDGLYELLPSALVAEKTSLAAGYAFWLYGTIDVGQEYHIEVTPYGHAFSHGGYGFLFLSVFLGFFLLFLFFRTFCPIFRNSIFAAFIIASYAHAMSAGLIWEPYSAVLRSLPFELMLFWIANLISRPRRVSTVAQN